MHSSLPIIVEASQDWLQLTKAPTFFNFVPVAKTLQFIREHDNKYVNQSSKVKCK